MKNIKIIARSLLVIIALMCFLRVFSKTFFGVIISHSDSCTAACMLILIVVTFKIYLEDINIFFKKD